MINTLFHFFCVPRQLSDVEMGKENSYYSSKRAITGSLPPDRIEIVIKDKPSSDSDDDDNNKEISVETINELNRINAGRPFLFPMENGLTKTIQIQQAINNYKTNPSGQTFKEILQRIQDLGFFPGGLTFSSKDILLLLKRYGTSSTIDNLFTNCKYFMHDCDVVSLKFEMMVRTGNLSNDVPSRVVRGNTPIYEYQRVNFLIPNEQDENGQTLVHHAIRWNNMPYLEQLLKIGYNPNVRDTAGKTAIFYTVGKAHKNGQAVSLLLENGIDLEIKDNTGKSWFEYAIIKHNKYNIDLVKQFQYNRAQTLLNKKLV